MTWSMPSLILCVKLNYYDYYDDGDDAWRTSRMQYPPQKSKEERTGVK
jgi:hypothetical protein